MNNQHSSEGFTDALGEHLQLALDHTSLDKALELVSQVAQDITRVEIGTPLVLSAGMMAVERVRAKVPHRITIVADVKICDAGERIARSALAAGADVITAVAAVIDEITWRGILSAIKESSRGVSGVSPILLDTIGPSIDIVALNRLAEAARDADISVDLCIHRPKSGSASFIELMAPFIEQRLFDRLIVAGKLNSIEVQAALQAGFDTLIVGGTVADAADPASAWNAFRSNVEAFHETRRMS